MAKRKKEVWGRKDPDEMPNYRLKRMIQEVGERGISELPPDALVAVECDDAVVVLSLESKGYAVFMIKDQIKLPDFKLRLSADQMQEFNRGAGIRSRFLWYKGTPERSFLDFCTKVKNWFIALFSGNQG